MAKSSGLGTILILAALVILAIFLIPSIRNTQRYGIHGQITTVNADIYKDELVLQQLTEIDWGIIDPGGSSSVTFYLKSTSNVPITLSYQASNWQPQGAQTYLSVSWDYSGVIIQPGAVQPVTMTLHVSELTTGFQEFAFDLTIIGTGGA